MDHMVIRTGFMKNLIAKIMKRTIRKKLGYEVDLDISDLEVTFDDGTGKMNLSIADVGGEMLIVSQFTLYGNCRKGNRPSYVDSASPEIARSLYEYFVEKVRSMGISVQEGEFQAHMHVSLLNDGPVTVIVDTPGAVEN